MVRCVTARSWESPVLVINNVNHHLVIKPDPEQGRTATPGRDLSIACISRGADPAPNLSFMIAGQNASEMYNVKVTLIRTHQILSLIHI